MGDEGEGRRQWRKGEKRWEAGGDTREDWGRERKEDEKKWTELGIRRRTEDAEKGKKRGETGGDEERFIREIDKDWRDN